MNNLVDSLTKNNNYQQLYCAVGEIVVNWAIVESIIDTIIWIFYHKCGGNSIINKKNFPRTQLNRKLTFLRVCLNSLPNLSPFVKDGLAFIENIEICSIDRHNIIHGLLNKSPKAIIMLKAKFGSDFNELKIKHYNINDLFILGKKIMGLAKDLSQYNSRLADKFVY